MSSPISQTRTRPHNNAHDDNTEDGGQDIRNKQAAFNHNLNADFVLAILCHVLSIHQLCLYDRQFIQSIKIEIKHIFVGNFEIGKYPAAVPAVDAKRFPGLITR